MEPVKKFVPIGRIMAVCGIVLVCSGQSARDKIPQGSVETDNENPVAVVISTIGPQRTFVAPVLLYTDEKGLSLGLTGFSPREAERIKSERCTRRLLKILLAASSVQQHWVRIEYGDTQMTFCRADGSRHLVQMNKEETSALVQGAKDELGTNSVALTYLDLINRDFPPADEDSLPPFMRKGAKGKKSK
jgi:hypothetical protein